MSISMYSASVPVFSALLDNLDHFLDKGLADAEARKYDPSCWPRAGWRRTCCLWRARC
jgi:hypothetical protein